MYNSSMLYAKRGGDAAAPRTDPLEPGKQKYGIYAGETSVASPQNKYRHPVYEKTYFDPQSIFELLNRYPLKMKKKLRVKIDKILKRYFKYPYKVKIGHAFNSFHAETRAKKDEWAETFSYTKPDKNLKKLRKGKWTKAQQVLNLKAYWVDQANLDANDPTRIEPFKVPIKNKILNATYYDPTSQLSKKCDKFIVPTDCKEGGICKWCKEQHFCVRTTNLDGTAYNCDMQVYSKSPLSGPTWNPKLFLTR